MERDVEIAWWLDRAFGDGRESAVFAASGGLGCAKTHSACQWHHRMVLINQKARFSGFMEPIYNLIKTAAIPTYEKVLQQCGYRKGIEYQVNYGPPPKIIYLKSGHQVLFQSGDNPNNIVAVEYSHITIDEAGTCHKESMENFRTRLRSPDAKLRQTMIVGAPHGVTGFAEEFDSGTLEGWNTDHWRVHTLDEKLYSRFILWTDDNQKYLPPNYIQRQIMDVYGHNPNLIKSKRYGLFCPLVEGSCYSNYFPQKHEFDDVEPSPSRELYLTWDFNANPLAWISLQKVAFNELHGRVHRYIAYHEANEGPTDIDQAVIEFQYKHPVRLFADTPIHIFGDSSGHASSHKTKHTDYQAIERNLRALGYRKVEVRAFTSNPSEMSSVEAAQRLFLNNLLLICKRCTRTKKSLMATTWKKGTRKIDKPSGETWTHHSDALKYFCFQEANDHTGGTVTRSYTHTW